jgi:hypothetical protein
MGEFRRWACLVLLVLTAAVCGGCTKEGDEAFFESISHEKLQDAFQQICWVHYPQPGDRDYAEYVICLDFFKL